MSNKFYKSGPFDGLWRSQYVVQTINLPVQFGLDCGLLHLPLLGYGLRRNGAHFFKRHLQIVHDMDKVMSAIKGTQTSSLLVCTEG
jgi:hypothetical protein